MEAVREVLNPNLNPVIFHESYSQLADIIRKTRCLFTGRPFWGKYNNAGEHVWRFPPNLSEMLAAVRSNDEHATCAWMRLSAERMRRGILSLAFSTIPRLAKKGLPSDVPVASRALVRWFFQVVFPRKNYGRLAMWLNSLRRLSTIARESSICAPR